MQTSIEAPWPKPLARADFGPYALLRPLQPGPLGKRWLARRRVELTAHVIHRLHMCASSEDIERFRSTVGRLQRLSSTHLLTPEYAGVRGGGEAWVASRYTGDRDGPVSLRRLVAMKGGLMERQEVRHTVEQLLQAIEYAHGMGVVHGPLSGEEILINRRGSVAIELYGLRRLLNHGGGTHCAQTLAREEIRSVAALAAEALLGRDVDDANLERRLESPPGASPVTSPVATQGSSSEISPGAGALGPWLRTALAPGAGFLTAAEAGAMLPWRLERDGGHTSDAAAAPRRPRACFRQSMKR